MTRRLRLTALVLAIPATAVAEVYPSDEQQIHDLMSAIPVLVALSILLGVAWRLGTRRWSFLVLGLVALATACALPLALMGFLAGASGFALYWVDLLWVAVLLGLAVVSLARSMRPA
jgi:hypothetical protein